MKDRGAEQLGEGQRGGAVGRRTRGKVGCEDRTGGLAVIQRMKHFRRGNVGRYSWVVGKIRSIFGRIRIQQIRILKPGSYNTGTHQESIQIGIKFFFIFNQISSDIFILIFFT